MAFDPATLDAACAALAAYDWGADAAPLAALDAAVVRAGTDMAVRAAVEPRLAAILTPETSRAAKEYACRKLCLIGTKASVPALAALLVDAENSHMARFALERIEGPEAAAALRAGLGVVTGDLRIGMISSLAARRDEPSVPLLTALLGAEPAVAVAAARALGRIGSPAAAAALAKVEASAGLVGAAAADARLACAEALLAADRRPEARAIYESLAAATSGRPEGRAVFLAATRGILACADTSVATR
jgi:HEAT repeat protein